MSALILPPTQVGWPSDVQIQYPYGAFELGYWLAEVVSANGKKLRYSPDHGGFFRAGHACWERMTEDEVLGFLRREHGDTLNEWVARWLKEEPREPAAQALRAGLRGPLWSSKLLLIALKEKLFRSLSTPPRCEMAFANGILSFGEGWHFESFDPEKHDHRAASSVVFSESFFEAEVQDPFLDLLGSWEISVDVEQYFRQLMAMALVGNLSRRYLIILGQGGCGKSLLRTVMGTALGDLAMVLPEDAFSRSGNHNAPLVDLILRNPKYVFLPEAQGGVVSASTINACTGQDPISARKPNDRDDTTGIIDSLPIFLGESPPIIRGVTSGTIERQSVVVLQPPKNRKGGGFLKDVRDPNHPLVVGFLSWLLNGVMQVGLTDVIPAVPEEIQGNNAASLSHQSPFLSWVLEQLNSGYWSEEGLTAAEAVQQFRAETDHDMGIMTAGRLMSGLSRHLKSVLRRGRTYYLAR